MGKNKFWEGGHHTYFVDGGTIRVGTPHNIKRKYVRNPFTYLPDTFWNIIDTLQTYPDTLKHLPHIPHTSPRHPRLRVEYKKLGGGGWVVGRWVGFST